MYLGAESAASSENPLKSLRIRADFDSTMRRFESSRPSQDLAGEPCALDSPTSTHNRSNRDTLLAGNIVTLLYVVWSDAHQKMHQYLRN
jgi:hypothetical protein